MHAIQVKTTICHHNMYSEITSKSCKEAKDTARKDVFILRGEKGKTLTRQDNIEISPDTACTQAYKSSLIIHGSFRTFSFERART